jgi:HEPN domain-containing protein
MLRFPDGTKIRVNGLNEILADLYSEGRQPNKEAAEEIVDRLERNDNYIPPSARREYKSVLLKEYRDYVAERKNKAP